MVIGDRLRMLREDKKYSQGEIEKRTGLDRVLKGAVRPYGCALLAPIIRVRPHSGGNC